MRGIKPSNLTPHHPRGQCPFRQEANGAEHAHEQLDDGAKIFRPWTEDDGEEEGRRKEIILKTLFFLAMGSTRNGSPTHPHKHTKSRNIPKICGLAQTFYVGAFVASPSSLPLTSPPSPNIPGLT